MGGTFNPPHSGHAHVARVAAARLGLDEVWVLPARGNPLKPAGAPFEVRLAAARRALERPGVKVLAFETACRSPFTVDVLAELKRATPGTRLVWIMGEDGLAILHRWRRWRHVSVTVPICFVSRPGASPRAGLSPFARTFAHARIPEREARRLPHADPPAWVVLHAPHDPASSTRLRRQRGSE